jgi:hypothetical protein
VKILAKLRDASKCGFVNHLEQFGLDRVRAVQAQAEAFGCKRVKGLVDDYEFVRYLMFLDYYQPIYWRIYL